MTARLPVAGVERAATLRPWEHPSRWSRLPSSVEPGQAATVEVRVRNTGSVVDEFTLDVLGDAAGWAAAEPADALAVPGRRGHRQGRLPAAARRDRPRRDASRSACAPARARTPPGRPSRRGRSRSGRSSTRSPSSSPRTSRGSGSGTHDLAVDNRGNAAPERRGRGAPTPTASSSSTSSRRAWSWSPAWRASRRSGSARSSGSGAASPRRGRSSCSSRPRAARRSRSTARCSRSRSCRPGSSRRCSPSIVLLIALVLIWLLLLKPTIQTAASEAVASPLASLKSGRQRGARAPPGLPTIGPEASGGSGESEAAVGAAPPSGEAPSGGATAVRRADEHAGRRDPGPRQPRRRAPRPARTRTVDVRRHPVPDRLRVLQPQRAPRARSWCSRNDTPLLQLRLENFRDYDLHFVTPIVARARTTR